MKKGCFCFFALFSLLFTIHLNAQKITLGVKGGLNSSSFGGSYMRASDTKNKLGCNFGLTADYSLFKNLYLTSGLEYSYKGGKESILVAFNDQSDIYEGNMTYNAGYLQIPIHFGYKEAVSSAISISIYAGPYFAYGIGGKVKGLEILSEEESASNPNFFGLSAKRFDAGAGVGAEVEFKAHYFLQFGYDLGLVNISKIDGTSIKNRNLYISAGYRF
jgi:Outer membrane protein beta-barrel domain